MIGICTGVMDAIEMSETVQCLFDKGCWFDDDGSSSWEVIEILRFFGIPNKGADVVQISKSSSVIDLHGKW